MRTIAPSHPLCHLPLFAWAEQRRAASPSKHLAGYRVTTRLEVVPIWTEIQHG